MILGHYVLKLTKDYCEKYQSYLNLLKRLISLSLSLSLSFSIFLSPTLSLSPHFPNPCRYLDYRLLTSQTWKEINFCCLIHPLGKLYSANINKNILLILGKADFRTRKFITNTEGFYIMIKETLPPRRHNNHDYVCTYQ